MAKTKIDGDRLRRARIQFQNAHDRLNKVLREGPHAVVDRQKVIYDIQEIVDEAMNLINEALP